MFTVICGPVVALSSCGQTSQAGLVSEHRPPVDAVIQRIITVIHVTQEFIELTSCTDVCRRPSTAKH